MSSKKLSLLIPLEMHRALKRQALESDTTISCIIQELIVRFLAEHGTILESGSPPLQSGLRQSSEADPSAGDPQAGPAVRQQTA
ncbi:MAG: hypothetical protein QM522_11945 [Chitinophagaceae bacterium]|nr:hypothetical protein [Chitinophagaceae bacterium]